MPQVLALSLRPKTFKQLYGQEKFVESVRKLMATRPPQSWLLHGPPGTGKTSVARIMAVAYQCTHQPKGEWGNPCSDCYDNRHNFSITEINASDTTGIDEIRVLTESVLYKPIAGSTKRVVILDEAHQISKSGQKLLLKPLEEPPPHLIWIMLTSEPNKIEAALLRRFAKYQFSNLGLDPVEKFLQRAAKSVQFEKSLEPLFEQVHLARIGSPGVLLNILEKYIAGSSPQDAVMDADGSTVDSYAICKAVTSGDWGKLKGLLKEASPSDSRLIRASVAGWLKGYLMNARSPKDATRAASSLTELCGPSPFDDPVLLPWLIGTLYKICMKYGSE